MKTLYLIDISSFIFRAFFAIRLLHNPKGEPTNAIYGVATMLAKLAEKEKPDHMAVIYDSKEPSFRKKVYEEYKANRGAPPDELKPQFSRIEEMIEKFKIPSFRQSGTEADDIIACLAEQWRAISKNHHVVIVTGDKDLMQLVGPQISVLDTMKDVLFRPKEVEEKFGIEPGQVRDYLSLIGDSSDNIPGVEGIGPKGAVELIKAYGNLEAILEAAKAGKIAGKKGQAIVLQEKMARLSHELVTLKLDLGINLDEAALRYQFKVNSEVLGFLKEMGFDSLVAKWSLEAPSLPEQTVEIPKAEAGHFHGVQTEKEFEQLIRKIEKYKEFAIDTETTSLNPRIAEFAGISIAFDTHEGFYIPMGHKDLLGQKCKGQLSEATVLQTLKPYLENPKYKKIGQNLKYDFTVFLNHGIRVDGIGADTMVASYLLEPEGRHGLDLLAKKHFNYQMLAFSEVCGKDRTFDHVEIPTAIRYSAEDAWMTMKLWDLFSQRLKNEKLMQVFAEVDLPVVSVLGDIENEGISLDEQWLKKLSNEFQKELIQIEEKIRTYTSGPVNLNSPKQLAHLLFEELKLPTQSKTKTGFSTDASVLEALQYMHEVPRLLLEYREISKLKGTYVDPLPLLKDPKDGKIHTSFHQTGTATGRLSSSDPNLQNIPTRSKRGQLIRKAFVASPGCELISADYSQIELRILAHMSEDEEFLDAFQNDLDIHRRTAAEIYKIKQDEVTDEQRSVAKAINFGLIYGKTAFGLSQELKISRKAAAEMIESYFNRYHKVKTFLDGLITSAKEKGYTETLLGRKRVLHDITSTNAMARNGAERMAMNTPIQGTAADMMKIAMVQVAHALSDKKFKAKVVLQVHDELLIDCPKDEVESVKKLTVKVMENAVKLKVPLKVNASSGPNWMEI